MLRATLRSIFRLLFTLLSHVQVAGMENIPEDAAIMSSNHLGRLDSVLIFAILERKNATGMVAAKYKKRPFFRWVVNSVDGIWINREETDFQALRQALSYLQGGGLLGIAPEGTRSPTGALMQAKIGVAYIADKAKVPIMPVGITGTEKAVRELFRFQRPYISVRFGRPFRLPPVDRRERNKALQLNTDEIMCQIAVLLPPAYRGVYADHPRLLELVDMNAVYHQG